MSVAMAMAMVVLWTVAGSAYVGIGVVVGARAHTIPLRRVDPSPEEHVLYHSVLHRAQFQHRMYCFVFCFWFPFSFLLSFLSVFLSFFLLVKVSKKGEMKGSKETFFLWIDVFQYGHDMCGCTSASARIY